MEGRVREMISASLHRASCGIMYVFMCVFV